MGNGGENSSGNIDLSEARKFLDEIIPQAGEILLGYFGSGRFTESSKGAVDFTTEADTKVDTFLTEALRNRFPQSNFLTEETAPEDYSSLSDAENLWIIDPLDGTINFSRNNPNFAISTALVDKGKVRLGFVHIPVTDESFTAREDKDGAERNGQALSVSNTSELKKALVGTDWPWDLKIRLQAADILKKLSQEARHIKILGSAVVQLVNVARGDVDAHIQPGLKPWDMAAASLIIQKAGGKVTAIDGGQWSPFTGDILASNGIIHDQLVELISAK